MLKNYQYTEFETRNSKTIKSFDILIVFKQNAIDYNIDKKLAAL